MKFTVVDLENEITALEKFVITCFLDVPTRGMVSIFVEVCSSQVGSFELITPTEVVIQQDEQFYLDAKTCARMFRGYIHLKGGEHIQSVGVKQLHVFPRKCEIRKVAPPPNVPNACCYSIGFDVGPPAQRSWGSWIYWVQPGEYSVGADHLSRVHFEFRVGNLSIENFYFFINQPPGYRLESSRCEVSSAKDPLVESPSLVEVYEFEVSDEFPVFPDWREYFYKRKILKNRRNIELKSGQQVSLFFSLTSEQAARKFAMRSYLIGIGIAMSMGIFTEVICSLVQGFTRVLFLVGSVILTLSLISLGWKLIK